jgi:hypothetical protein
MNRTTNYDKNATLSAIARYPLAPRLELKEAMANS